MKKECRIVQDLLPNYLEEVTNEETNQFIREHIVGCKECKEVYLAMQQELKVNSFDTKETINYMKRFKTKLKIFRNVLLIILVIFIIIVGRKALILARLFNTSNELYDKNNYEKIQTEQGSWMPNDLNNYYSKSIATQNDGKIILIEEYRKDGKALTTVKTSNVYEKETYTLETMYSDGKESLAFTEDFKENTITIRDGNLLQGGIGQVPSLSDGYWDIYFKYLLFADIYETKLIDKECYVIKIDNTEQYVDKETGTIIKVINNDYNVVTDFYYEFGTVTDDDIKKPNIPMQNY